MVRCGSDIELIGGSLNGVVRRGSGDCLSDSGGEIALADRCFKKSDLLAPSLGKERGSSLPFRVGETAGAVATLSLCVVKRPSFSESMEAQCLYIVISVKDRERLSALAERAKAAGVISAGHAWGVGGT